MQQESNFGERKGGEKKKNLLNWLAGSRQSKHLDSESIPTSMKVWTDDWQWKRCKWKKRQQNKSENFQIAKLKMILWTFNNANLNMNF